MRGPRLAVAIFIAGSLVLVAALYVVSSLRAPTVGPGGGPVAIGGPFSLLDQHGETRTPEDFAGRYMLIYFGFTFCPDICPTTLQVMALALDELGADASAVQPIFITVDPERDTVEHMKAYAAQFDMGLVALTGAPDRVAEALKAYRVYAAKQEVDGEEGYLMDHTSIVYLMNGSGDYVAHFNHQTTTEEMAAKIRELL